MLTAASHRFRPAAFGLVISILFVGASARASDGKPLPGDPDRGKTLYQACTGCHSPDENDVGPKHRGVVGRRAGVVPGYPYSAALKGSALTWDAVTLDRWLTNPQALVPGAKMFFSVADAQKRADIIAYLDRLR